MTKLSDKVAIVTGAARGIGLAIAKRFVAEGAKVMLADINETDGAAAAKALGGHARFTRCDVGDAKDAAKLVNETIKAFGGVDLLVNNAGIIHAADFLDIKEADFDRVLRVNMKGVFLVGQAAARRMVEQVKAGKKPGAIVNMSSINAVVAIAEPSALCRVQGRRRPAHARHGAGAGALRHPRERHRAGLDHDRHSERRRNRPARPSGGFSRARPWAASASPRRSPRSPLSSPRTMRAT